MTLKRHQWLATWFEATPNYRTGRAHHEASFLVVNLWPATLARYHNLTKNSQLKYTCLDFTPKRITTRALSCKASQKTQTTASAETSSIQILIAAIPTPLRNASQYPDWTLVCILSSQTASKPITQSPFTAAYNPAAADGYWLWMPRLCSGRKLRQLCNSGKEKKNAENIRVSNVR